MSLIESLPAQLGTLPSWITAGGVVAILGVVSRGLNDYLKTRIESRRVTLGDDAAQRAERRADDRDCQARLDAMAKRIDAVEMHAHAMEIKLAGALSAYRIVEVAYDADHPGSVAVAQARAVLRTAFALGELPPELGELVRRIDPDGKGDAA